MAFRLSRHVWQARSSWTRLSSRLLVAQRHDAWARLGVKRGWSSQTTNFPPPNHIAPRDRIEDEDVEDEEDIEDEDDEEWEERLNEYDQYYADEQVPIKRVSFSRIDLEGPHLWFTQARRMRRKVFLHVGPTNSGKTHRAIERLRESKLGLYAAPLRLLAWQVSNDLNCNLITGQEAVEVEGSLITSCTVEMCDVETEYDCAVVDEIQLVSSSDRGSAFSRALLGIQARELHLCGEPGVVELIRKICDITNDELVVNHYKRLSPLEHLEEPVGSLASVQPGDCVVVFSRKMVYKVKQSIESLTKHKCAIVYGSLPPETRKDQATLFNEGKTYSVLVATDAIGMGLNLTIKRVIFNQLQKFDGKEERQLTTREIRQIAGRAGRYGLLEADKGFAGALSADDHNIVKMAISSPTPVQVGTCYVYPPKEFVRARFHNVFIDCLQAELPRFEEFLVSSEEKVQETRKPRKKRHIRTMIARQADIIVGRAVHRAFCNVIDEIEATRQEALAASTEEESKGPFLVAEVDELRDVLKVLENIPLDVRTLQTLCDAPVNIGDPQAARALEQYAAQHRKSAGEIISLTFLDPFYHELFASYMAYDKFSPGLDKRPIKLPTVKLRPVRGTKTTAGDMNELEKNYHVLELGMWLSWRFDHTEEERETVMKVREQCMRMIRNGLEAAADKAKKPRDKNQIAKNPRTPRTTTGTKRHKNKTKEQQRGEAS